MDEELQNLYNALKEAVTYDTDCVEHEDCAHCDAIHMLEKLAKDTHWVFFKTHKLQDDIQCTYDNRENNWKSEAKSLMTDLEEYVDTN